jgi:hypothetical protein
MGIFAQAAGYDGDIRPRSTGRVRAYICMPLFVEENPPHVQLRQSLLIYSLPGS